MLRRGAVILLVLLALGAAETAEAGPRLSWKRVEAEFRRTFKGPDELGRAIAVLNLGKSGYPEAGDLIVQVLEDRPTPAVFVYGVHGLNRLVDRANLNRVLEVSDKAGSLARAAVLLGIRSHLQTAARVRISRELGDGDVRVRAAAVTALGHRMREGQEERLRDALADPAWPVQAAAIEAVVRLELEGAARGLPPLLESKRSRIRSAAYEALRSLTGKDFGFDRELWERWLDSGREGTGEDERYGRPSFYGIHVIGDRPVFVLDVSKSMNEPIRIPVEKLRRAVAGGSGTRARVDWRKVRTKLDLAKAEFAAALEELPKSAKFGLVFYSDTVEVWKPGLVSATRANVVAAVTRVESLGARGKTNIYDALLRALDISGGDDVLSTDLEGVDQILFLTDGKANRGTIRFGSCIWSVMEVIHMIRRVRVDCVGVGNHDRSLLQYLAERTHGRYVAVGD